MGVCIFPSCVRTAKPSLKKTPPISWMFIGNGSLRLRQPWTFSGNNTRRRCCNRKRIIKRRAPPCLGQRDHLRKISATDSIRWRRSRHDLPRRSPAYKHPAGKRYDWSTAAMPSLQPLPDTEASSPPTKQHSLPAVQHTAAIGVFSFSISGARGASIGVFSFYTYPPPRFPKTSILQ